MMTLPTGWKIHEGNCHSLWQRWWGNKVDFAANVPVRLPWLSDDFLHRTSGDLFVRQAYIAMYKRLQAICTADSTSGVVITGQPGTGKSYSLIVFLLLRLMAQQPTVFYIWSEIIFFGSDHVYSKLDARNGSLPDKTPAGLFPIHATSPNPNRYKSWSKQFRAYLWLLPKWTFEELMECARIQKGLPAITHRDLQSLIDKWGYAPHDIFDRPGWSKNYSELKAALDALDADKLRTVVIRTSTGDMHNTISHDLFCIYRAGENPMDDDPFDIDIKSPHICALLRQRFGVIKFEDAQTFYRLCKCYSESAILAGWSFESLAIEVLRKAPHTGSVVIPPPSPMHADELDELIRSWNEGHASIDSTHQSFFAQRDIRGFKSCLDVDLDDTKIYVPIQSNFPFLDAFFVSQASDKKTKSVTVTVSVLQMTMAVTHKGSANGFEFLLELRNRLSDLATRSLPRFQVAIKFVYYLVVPKSSRTGELKWVLPEVMPDDINGSFFLQRIPVKDGPDLPEDNEEDETSYSVG